MATTELTMGNVEDTVAGNGIVFVDFWAGWCGRCRQPAPVDAKAAAAHPDIVLGKVDTEAVRDAEVRSGDSARTH